MEMGLRRVVIVSVVVPVVVSVVVGGRRGRVWIIFIEMPDINI